MRPRPLRSIPTPSSLRYRQQPAAPEETDAHPGPKKLDSVALARNPARLLTFVYRIPQAQMRSAAAADALGAVPGVSSHLEPSREAATFDPGVQPEPVSP